MQAKIIQTAGKMSLVEYKDEDGTPQRVYLPALRNAVGSRVEVENPEQGIPYAEVSFNKDVKIPVSTLNTALRNVGIWTRADLAKSPHLYVQAVTGAVGLSLNEILKKE